MFVKGGLGVFSFDALSHPRNNITINNDDKYFIIGLL
jgi:hypothetical protein